ncbi:MAG: hypothetical protein ABW170_10665 [Candidatus Thiodiazotropha sp. L084R]
MCSDLGRLVKGVGDAGTIALAVVAVGGDVGDIDPGAIDRLDLALGGVGIADGAISLCRYWCYQTQA